MNFITTILAVMFSTSSFADSVNSYAGEYKLLEVTYTPTDTNISICNEKLEVWYREDNCLKFFMLGHDWRYETDMNLAIRTCSMSEDFFGGRYVNCNITTQDTEGFYTKKSCVKKGQSAKSCVPNDRMITFKKINHLLFINGTYTKNPIGEDGRTFECVYSKVK